MDSKEATGTPFRLGALSQWLAPNFRLHSLHARSAARPRERGNASHALVTQRESELPSRRAVC